MLALYQERLAVILELSTPPREKSPSGTPDTRPQTVQGILTALPINKPAQAAQALIAPLETLNRHPVTSELRLQLLELYRPMILKIVHGLTAQYSNASLPLTGLAKDSAQLVKALLTELAFGYKICVLERGKGLFGGVNNKMLPLMAQRAIHAISQLVTVSYHTYARMPKKYWSELHQLYQLTAEHKLQGAEVEDTDGKCSPELAYKRALLLFLAAPRHLSAADIDRVWAYLLRFGHLAQLQPLHAQQNTSGAFLVKLQSDTPPIPFNKMSGEANPQTDIQLMTEALTKQLAGQIQRLNANEPPKNLGLPITVVDQRYQDLLAHLLKHWVQAPKRTFPRLEKNTVVSLCVGLPALNYFLNGETRYVLPTAPDSAMEVTEIRSSYTASGAASVAVDTHGSSRWSVINESAGGLALARIDDASGGVRLGQLVGLQTEKNLPWSLCVVRWAASNEQDGLEIGIQMIAPTAIPIAVRTDGENTFELALQLSEIAALKQPETLVTVHGGYWPARVMEIDRHGKTALVLATRLVERTNCYERFEFSRL